MLDSSGRIPPGFLAGGLSFWGSPQQCQRIDFKIPGRGRAFQGSYSR